MPSVAGCGRRLSATLIGRCFAASTSDLTSWKAESRRTNTQESSMSVRQK